ncbi:poly-gamma-glutamate hydrolase family protein [Methylocystis sp. B8]|uniref:poly-gamma-glutamate hydrolase family protein n=1 Tax=Methylocystis sp. B8 TaxID=544938 RepID=UPI001FF07C3B|nr:poly-gamma-glutamate hydrolase family protein [Methylocystis sp. B8]
MADRYDSFATLAANEIEGVDYRIRVDERASPFAVIAPHGGLIERQARERRF